MENVKNKNFIDKIDDREFKLDSVKVSEIELARSIIDKLPDIREDKIKKLQEKYNDPNYEVSPEDIAEKILENLKCDK